MSSAEATEPQGVGPSHPGAVGVGREGAGGRVQATRKPQAPARRGAGPAWLKLQGTLMDFSAWARTNEAT